jgi:hypothetical protein
LAEAAVRQVQLRLLLERLHLHRIGIQVMEVWLVAVLVTLEQAVEVPLLLALVLLTLEVEVLEAVAVAEVMVTLAAVLEALV